MAPPAASRLQGELHREVLEIMAPLTGTSEWVDQEEVAVFLWVEVTAVTEVCTEVEEAGEVEPAQDRLVVPVETEQTES